jgi:hypothetical protein
MQVIETTYAFLTKRSIAVDHLECRHAHGKYRLDVQVAQLDCKWFLWGAEVITDEVRIVSPKFIVKKNSLWLLEY